MPSVIALGIITSNWSKVHAVSLCITLDTCLGEYKVIGGPEVPITSPGIFSAAAVHKYTAVGAFLSGCLGSHNSFVGTVVRLDIPLWARISKA